MSKLRVLLLCGAALLTLSGGRMATSYAAADPSAPSASEPPAAAVDVTARIAELNPHLAPSQHARIRAAIERYAKQYGLDPLLVTAVIEVESAGRPWARSPKGALGLMQVMPYMIEPMGLAGNPATIEANIEAGCRILAANIARLGEADGISAYFWGSDIRGVTYLNRVRAAQHRLRRPLPS
jgi:soluble lytic murein transglycosylase-like protein